MEQIWGTGLQDWNRIAGLEQDYRIQFEVRRGFRGGQKRKKEIDTDLGTGLEGLKEELRGE